MASISILGSAILTVEASSTNGSWVGCCPSNFNYYAFEVDHHIPSGGTDTYTGVIPPSGSCIKYDANQKSILNYNDDVSTLQDGVSGMTLENDTSSNNANPIVIGEKVGAPKICSQDASCSLVKYDNPELCPDPFNDSTCIVPSNTLKQNEGSTWQCQSCISSGRAVGVVDLSSSRFQGIGGDATSRNGKIAICQSNGTVLYAEGVNGSISDTEACLKSEGGYESENYNLCKQCRESGGTWSGLGCVDSTPTGLITWVMRIAYGVMGGVALIQFIIAGVYYQTGQEEKVKEARKGIIATLTGLAVLTFSILILRVIGINILDILPTGSF
jgi:hypothetical protein